MIHDFIPNYPLLEDEDINVKLTSRVEFNELESKKIEIPGKNGFFNHQNLILRYMKNFDRLFLFHETGTGKSGTFVNTAEYFKKHPEEGIVQAVALEPGPATIKNIEDQIIKHSSIGEYENEKTERATNISTLKRNRTSMIKKWYLIEGYETFSRRIRKLTDEDIKKQFSDTFFFLDEIHVIRNLGEKGIDDKENKYESLWRVFHAAERIKVIVSTATPFVNSTRDFVGMVNLLLPEDKQLPFSWDYSKVTYKQLKPYLNGMVTFLRSSDTGIKIKREGSLIKNDKGDVYTHEIMIPKNEMEGSPIKPVKKHIQNGKIISTPDPIQKEIDMKKKVVTTQTIVKTLEMKKIQRLGYAKAVVKNKNAKKKDSFLLNESYASLWVFPPLKKLDGKIEINFGEEGFKENLEIVDDEVIMKPEFKKAFDSNEQGLKTLKNCGCKIHFFVDNEIKEKGKSFCYLEFVKNTGTDLLGAILENFTYNGDNEHLKGKKFENYKGGSKGVFIKEAGSQKKKIRESFKKKPRFAIFTSESKNIDSMLELFNSEENIDGDYLKIMIVSKTASVGINLDDVIRGYIMSPGWHESGMHQAESRFLRATSHVRLLKKYGSIEVKLYNLAAVYKKADVSNSSDIRKYILAERKDIQNKRLANILKKLAFDSFINYRRNYLLTDRDLEKEVDYETRMPKLPDAINNVNEKSKDIAYGQLENNNIYTTKDLLYFQDEVSDIKSLIRNELKNKRNILVKDLYSITKEWRKIYTTIAIDEILTEKEPLKDDYGYDLYIVLYGKNLYLTRDYPYSSQKKIPSTYSDILVVNEKAELEYKLSEKESGEKLESIIQDIRKKGISKDIIHLTNYFIKLKSDVIFKLMEYSVVHEKEDILFENIKNLFDLYLYKIKYPKTNIEMAEKQMKMPRGPAVGRKPSEHSKTILKNLEYVEPDGDRDIYIHFYPILNSNSSFSINAIFTRPEKEIRIYDPSIDKDFRDATVVESHVYNWIVQKEYSRKMKKFTDKNIYGSRIYRDNKFRIHQLEPEKINRICSTMNEGQIKDILKTLGVKDLESKGVKVQLESLCNKLEETLEKQGRLLVTF